MKWLVATTLVNSEPKPVAPPHSVAASWQEQPSSLVYGRAGRQLRALGSTDRNDYNPCKALTPRCCRNPASCRAAVETWRMYQCLFQHRAKPLRWIRSHLSFVMLSGRRKSATLRSDSTTNTRTKVAVTILYRSAMSWRSHWTSTWIKKIRCRGEVREQSGSTC
jgi:hypothetical protein